MNKYLFYLVQFKESVKRKGLIDTVKNTSMVFLYPLYRKVWSEWILGSYSLLEDDLLLEELLGKGKLFYVDVGACSPDYISNTKRFYLRGSSGINIEPNPDLIRDFHTRRPRDLNLEVAISDKKGIVKLSVFNVKGHGTLSAAQVDEWKGEGKRITDEMTVEADTLKNVLGMYCHQPIDFMNIDADGSELQILKSNDWNNFRPKAIILETPTEEMKKLLANLGYRFYKETVWCDVPVNKIYYDTLQLEARQ